jgi:CDP-diacylglycerol---serine O-phosphatidyltransferase
MIKKQIPNLFTLLNLFFGCIAVVYITTPGIIITAGAEGESLIEIPQQIYRASLCLALAAVVDYFDGFLARLLGSSSEMGKHLDSLADLVSFGVAPSLIAYQFLRLSLAQDMDGLSASWFQLLPVFILPCAAAYRLARFNISAPSSTGFTGVPVPAVGLLFASFPIIYWYAPMEQAAVTGLLLNKWFWYAVVLGCSYLMVSTLPMMAFKFSQISFKKLLPLLILVAIGLISAISFGWIAVPIVFIAYVVLSLSLKYWYV